VALDSPKLGCILFTLYITWSPWHYSGQNYGLAVMFLARRGVAPGPRAKRWLQTSFLLSFVLAAIVMHVKVDAAYGLFDYGGRAASSLPIGIPRGAADAILPVVAAAYLVSLIGAVRMIRRSASWSDLLPAVALAFTQALWFAIPASIRFWGWHTGMEPLDAA